MVEDKYIKVKQTVAKVKKTKSIPKGLFHRAGLLMVAGAGIMSKEVGARLSKSFAGHSPADLTYRIKQVQELTNTLAKLRGAALKAGQLLSFELRDFLPREIIAIFERLYDDAYYISENEVKAILLKELGADKFAHLQDLSPEPIAAASIGQVHKVTIAGKLAVLKIQFPGIAKSIDSDLALLKKIVTTSLVIFNRGKIEFSGVFDEMAITLKREVDYQREAKNIFAYKQAFHNDPRFVIPSVIEAYSTKRILAMSYEEGERVNVWLSQALRKEERSWFAEQIVDLVFHEFFVIGLVQTDPNYGNFFVRPAQKQIICLDFGAVRSYSKKFRQDLRDLILLTIEGDRAGLLKKAFALELLDPRESVGVQNLFLDLMEKLVEIFDPSLQPFPFVQEKFYREVRTLALSLIREVHYSAPARQLIFLNRKLGGMYHLLRLAEAEVDMAPYLNRICKIKIQ